MSTSRPTIAERVAAESPYMRAAAEWVARRIGKPVHLIWGVDFAVNQGGYCETCSYESPGIEYWYNGKHDVYELSWDERTAGGFIEECVEILQEQS